MKVTIHAKASFIAWRFYLVIGLILLIVVGLSVRLIDLSVLNQRFLLNESNARVMRTVHDLAFRGMIKDRNGFPLAVSTSIYSIWVNPEEFKLSHDNLQTLGELLEIKPASIQKTIQNASHYQREFVYLKRGVSPEIANQVKHEKIPGTYLQEGFKRFYPDGEVAAHIIGMTDVDDRGKEGLELLYDKWLAGSPGKRRVIKDRMGREIDELKTIQEVTPGKDITLSIDRRIQYLAYRELMTGVQSNLAESGSAVVLDIKTGEVLAMVNQPAYNPNNKVSGKSENFRNRAVTDLFEPGSTMKAFSVAVALNSGKFKPDTIIDTTPGWIRVGHNIVRDEHFKGPMTVTEILQVSSDVGVTKMILEMPPNHLWNLLHQLGFGELTGIGFPGEQAGRLVKRTVWKPFALATLSWGYGISITPLQLAHAYATLANDGIKIPVSLLKVDALPKGEQVIDKKLANQMVTILEAVLEKSGKGGTGLKARIPGYRVSGKTGTARIAGAHGYEKHHHMSSFVGVAPATNPRFVVAVVIRDPQGKVYYGGDVSAPVFKNIMQGTLRILNVPPDDLASLEPKTEKAAG